MELSEEVTNILHKNTIQYLHDLADKVPDSLNVLKSYYASKFRISELQTKICLKKSKNKLDARCPKCCLKLRETGATCYVKPETHKSKFAKKLLKKVQAQKRLTHFQIKYLKNNNINAENTLVITCNFCKKEISHRCNKSVKRRKYQKAKNQNKKNAKKKDKFCGLKEEAVISVQNETHKILNNEFTKRKEILQEKRKLSKLTKMLKQKSNNKSGSALTQFLQSLNK
ncbi:hypothetical protein TcasGA2_TC013366 [Tribolium castaneum]|uniref:Uncharacterized protein n=1 Tax=Tribolium castaneum TaxID=7070 RepID=D6WLZ2_TRICA|nr:PREDICTED: uncharacterized protein LOC663636 [Tribolium castaneum]EFA03380.1 hypothetical protein TcasGA2_TC013366 [Tribolium castaneum]|eukprot:XP_976459.1 PREDICTED: uncharacterized protein LOC663636 [Tribolium castaneum]